MRHRSLAATAVLLVAVSALVVGCKQPKTTPVAPPPQTQTAKPAETSPAPPTEVTEKFPTQPVETAPLSDPGVDELNRRKPLQTVYFSYDSTEFDEAAIAAMRANAAWLKANPKHPIRIEGNSDERGTIKYNLALGQRRGDAVRQYLSSLGVPADRMRVVSYGEEKPVNEGHDEGSWKQNRRAEFWIE
jgi:peptidoglycan-associated lipoprotein